MSLRIHLSLLSVLLLNNCNNKKESVATVINETVIFETKLSKKIDETSGLEYFNEGLITHNDSGDDAKLYLFSQTGELLEEFVVNDALFQSVSFHLLVILCHQHKQLFYLQIDKTKSRNRD